jgi:hypothetical protein
MTNGAGKSDSSVVPGKPPNKAGQPAAEVVEGRGLAKGNPPESNTLRTQGRDGVPSALERIRQAARKDRKQQFTALLHHVYICGKTRKGWFTVLRQTMRKRWQAKIQAVRAELKRRLHDPVPEVGAYLRSVVTGHFRYYGVPRNGPALGAFRQAVARTWRWVLMRRSQMSRMPWSRFAKYVARWLPIPRFCHPYPSQRFAVTTQGKSRMR